MSHQKITVMGAVVLVGTLVIGGNALANTCPIDLQQNSDGYWFSEAKPGWKSHKPTPSGVTLSAEDFGGVVYSPKRKRLACVYKASDGKWIALVSNVHQAIKVSPAKDDAGKGPAWLHSKTHGDYACGKPNVSSITNCVFTLE